MSFSVIDFGFVCFAIADQTLFVMSNQHAWIWHLPTLWFNNKKKNCIMLSATTKPASRFLLWTQALYQDFQNIELQRHIAKATFKTFLLYSTMRDKLLLPRYWVIKKSIINDVRPMAMNEAIAACGKWESPMIFAAVIYRGKCCQFWKYIQSFGLLYSNQ